MRKIHEGMSVTMDPRLRWDDLITDSQWFHCCSWFSWRSLRLGGSDLKFRKYFRSPPRAQILRQGEPQRLRLRRRTAQRAADDARAVGCADEAAQAQAL